MKFILFILILCLTPFVHADIKNIPNHDLKKIKYLFKSLIDDHDFSYTIFGSKPMSLADFSLETPQNLPFFRWVGSKNLMFKRKTSLDAWYKYRKEFDLKDFIFLDEERDWISCLILVLINKKNMLVVLHEHEVIFKEELGEDFSPESFLKKLEKKEMSLAKAINDSQKLMGIMLGYGRRNASLFQEKYNVMKAIREREKENLPQDEMLIKKLADVEVHCNDFSELEKDAIVHPLYFLADTSHHETVNLKIKYEEDRRKIEKLMRQSKFMNNVLDRLTK